VRVAGGRLVAVEAGAVAAGCVGDAGDEEAQAGRSSMPASASQANIFKDFKAFSNLFRVFQEKVFNHNIIEGIGKEEQPCDRPGAVVRRMGCLNSSQS
jgi:hypothetical protein